MSEPVPLRLRSISKRFGDLLANDAISFDLAPNEILALLGENGAGKTTLLNILCGHYEQDEGEIELFGKSLPRGSPRAALAGGIGVVNQHSLLADNETTLDNIVLGTEPLWKPRRNNDAARQQLTDLLDKSGLTVPLDVPVGMLSVGEQQRVEILKALYRKARILILDEPTAILTPQESNRLFGILRRLASGGMSVIFVSHRLSEVMALSHRVIVLRDGRVVAEVKTSNSSATALTNAMVGASVPSLRRQKADPGEVILGLHGVSLEDARGRRLLNSLYIELRRHEIVGIAGVSGNGQTALSEIIAGLAVPSSGCLSVEGAEVVRPSAAKMSALGVGRIPEDRRSTGIIGEMSIEENLIGECYSTYPYARWGVLRLAEIRRYAREMIAAYDIRGGGPNSRAADLSGGNMQKIVLARVLSRGPQVILAHQPTRGLDVANTARVHQQLLDARQRGAGILLISEDLDELIALSDRISVMYRGCISQPVRVSETNTQMLGLLMSGQGYDRARNHERGI
jgi:simple sugar transport system ATP-binding protein